jgi:glucosyl-3-phosphoglycerate synthase
METTPQRPDRVAAVIPAKDEESRLEATIRAVQRLRRVDLVVVVDDGSTDATSAIAQGAGAVTVRHRRNHGKAAAMATGAKVVAMRDEAERAEGDSTVPHELLTEPRADGHTGPLPVIDSSRAPRALLFVDADLGETAANAQPLVDAVLDRDVDMAIALLPPQKTAGGGHGIVVRTARRGIERTTGWSPEQPLSGTRCLTREAWEACQPLARGWGVETSLTIDALRSGFWVQEVPCDLHHRVTGRDLGGQVHRAAQLRDVLWALATHRGGSLPASDEPEELADELARAVRAAESTRPGPGAGTTGPEHDEPGPPRPDREPDPDPYREERTP